MSRNTIVSQGLELVVFVGEEIHRLDLPFEGTVSIGRGEDCTVRINDPSVSRHHAVLHVGSELVIEDLGSVNGTMIRDAATAVAPIDTVDIRHLIARKAAFSTGDTLLFGSARAVVRCSPGGQGTGHSARSEEVVVRDPAMCALYEQAALAAGAHINVLLLGETGVGKEVLARAIHAGSPRAKRPLQVINCAALCDTLLEGELFGHEKGAFTGAMQARAGLFEAASGSTVLLDEVGELAPSVQAKLLRVIEDRVVTRLGSSRPRAVDVRIIAATNRDLEEDCETGRFRRDLFFRLNGLSFWIPPLRERPLEIEHLARTFLADTCRLLERSEIPGLSPDVMVCLRAYPWPGNVRELRHAMERAAILCSGAALSLEHLPVSITRGPAPVRRRSGTIEIPSSADADLPRASADLPAQIRSLERARIIEALEQSRGSQSAAARLLGISRRTLISRIEDFGLPRPRRRAGTVGP